MNLFKKSILITIILTITLLQNNQAAVYDIKIVARVHTTVITSFDIEQEVFQAEQYLKKSGKYKKNELKTKLQEIRNMALDRLIERELIYAEFQRKGYNIPNHLLQQRLNKIVVREAGGDWETFEKQLIRDNSNLEELKEKIRKSMAIEMLLNSRSHFNTNISETAIRKFYSEHQELFQRIPRYKLELIQINKNGKNKQDPQIIEQQIRVKLKQGITFAELAKKYSDSPNASKGGTLGWTREKDLNKPFLNALSNLKCGEITKTITISDNLYILHLLEQEKKGIIPLTDELKIKISEQLKLKLMQKQQKEFIQTLYQQFYVKKYNQKKTNA